MIAAADDVGDADDDDDDDDDGAADDDGNDDFELDHLAIRWPASETCDPTIYQDCTNMAPS